MTNIYCEGAAGAEITFSLTGGREGKIISYNPSVRVGCNNGNLVFIGGYNITAPGDNRTVFRYFHPEFGTDTEKDLWQIVNVIRKEDLSVARNGIGIVKYDFNNCIEYEGGEAYCPTTIIHFTDFTNTETFASASYSGSIAKKKFFYIEDQSGILYGFEYPGGCPSYQVNCISCPDGMCPIIDRLGKIQCFDCKRVLNGLGRISGNLDKIL